MLALLLPAAFTFGLAARKSTPLATALPALLPMPNQFASVEWKRGDLFSKIPVTLRLLREQKNGGRFGIELLADKNFLEPDLMVYWVPDKSYKADILPNDAILLGAFDSATLPLPETLLKSGGSLILYSLADAEIVDSSKPLPLDGVFSPAN